MTAFGDIRALWRRLGPAGRLALVAAVAAATIYGGGKAGSVYVDDPYIEDAGSYLTNDFVHVAIAKRTPLLPDDAEILVYARELASTNAADWVRLTPHLTYADHPHNYALQNATNHNVLVAASYIPAPTVHTNGVWSINGFVIPGSAGKMAFAGTRVRIPRAENPARYVRFDIAKKIGSGNGLVQVSKIEVVMEDDSVFEWGDVSVSATGLAASGSSAELPEKLFDGSVDTKMCRSVTMPCSIVADLGSARLDASRVAKWRWYTANDSASNYSRNPVSFSLSFSLDGETWTVADSAEDHEPPKKNRVVGYEGNIEIEGPL